jgi:protein CpxP
MDRGAAAAFPKDLTMTDPTSADAPAPAPEGTPKAAPQPARPTRRWTLGAIAAASVAAIGAAGWHFAAHAHGPGRGGMGWHGAMDPATMGKRIEAMTAWMLADIDATPEQRTRVAAVFKAAAAELAPLRAQHQQARRESLQLLAAPTVDRARLESMRIQQMQLGDTVSRRMLQAVLDAAEALNPDQRARLVERWQARMQRRS